MILICKCCRRIAFDSKTGDAFFCNCTHTNEYSVGIIREQTEEEKEREMRRDFFVVTEEEIYREEICVFCGERIGVEKARKVLIISPKKLDGEKRLAHKKCVKNFVKEYQKERMSLSCWNFWYNYDRATEKIMKTAREIFK